MAILDKVEIPFRNGEPCYGSGSFTGTQRKTNQLKQVVGARSMQSSKCEFFRTGRAAARVISFRLPLLLGHPARRLTRERSLEDPRKGALRRNEKWRHRPVTWATAPVVQGIKLCLTASGPGANGIKRRCGFVIS